jgi:hypothetical protein
MALTNLTKLDHTRLEITPTLLRTEPSPSTNSRIITAHHTSHPKRMHWLRSTGTTPHQPTYCIHTGLIRLSHAAGVSWCLMVWTAKSRPDWRIGAAVLVLDEVQM